MFKAFDKQENREIIILDRFGEGELSALRQRGRDGILSCHCCHSVVIVKAGEVVRHHFAHKHLSPNCPAAHDSAMLLHARAELYLWLKRKFATGVTLEKRLDGFELPRPLDCWVETPNGQMHAYVVLDRNLKPVQRDTLTSAVASVSATLHVVFLSGMLHRDEARPNAFQLHTTERGFLAKTPYDDMYVLPEERFRRGGGSSIHYFDAAARVLTTFRDVHCVSWPRVHCGVEKAVALDDLLIAPRTGIFVLPGEWDRLEAYRTEEAKLAASRDAEVRERMAAARRGVHTRPLSRFPRSTLSSSSSAHSAAPLPSASVNEPASYENKEGRCVFCGEVTREWWSFDGTTGTCKCNACKRGGIVSQ
jgi:hypothetical protein